MSEQPTSHDVTAHDNDRGSDDSDDDEFLEIQKATAGTSKQTESLQSNLKLPNERSKSTSMKSESDDFVMMDDDESEDDDCDDVSDDSNSLDDDDDNDSDENEEESDDEDSGDKKATHNTKQRANKQTKSSDVQEGRTVFIRYKDNSSNF